MTHPFGEAVSPAEIDQYLRNAIDDLEAGRVSPRPIRLAYGQSGLAGKRAHVLVDVPTDECDNRAALPEGTRQVVILDDTPNPHHTLRVHPVDDPTTVALVVYDQLSLADNQD